MTPVEPPKTQFVVRRPIGASTLAVDVIQLTAQFVASNGRNFIAGIADREKNNPQVDAAPVADGFCASHLRSLRIPVDYVCCAV